MKDICQCLFEYLTSSKELATKVGRKVFPLIMPQETLLPAIVYSPINASYDSALSGDTGYTRQTIQFNCHDKTFKKARELSRIVKKLLQDYTGDMNGVNIQSVFVKSDFMLNGNTADKYATEEFMAVIEFEICFNEERETLK
ncbi:MAG: DUF3168 domain-containing protein [Clostridia bacterium]